MVMIVLQLVISIIMIVIIVMIVIVSTGIWKGTNMVSTNGVSANLMFLTGLFGYSR